MPAGTGAWIRLPFTKCVSGTLSGVARPGSAWSAVGISAFLRKRAMGSSFDGVVREGPEVWGWWRANSSGGKTAKACSERGVQTHEQEYAAFRPRLSHEPRRRSAWAARRAEAVITRARL